FDLREAVEAMALAHGVQAAQKDIEFIAFVDPRLAAARVGDPGRFQQVLLNLVANAIKFTETGEVTVEVRAVGDAPTGEMLRVSIRDTGIGIPEDRISALFSPFAQVDAST